ncbi:MAG: argininosuccinate lyase [Bacteroidia bacterium]
MQTKIWNKNTTKNPQWLEEFTIGSDRSFDLLLAPHDVKASMAHANMLAGCGLITHEDNDLLQHELKNILVTVFQGNFILEETVEDVHSQIEFILTEKLGDTGKKIHTGRSRNDQVLTALKLFIKEELKTVSQNVEELFDLLQKLSEKYKNVLIPGYTHLQIAMPSSFGLWFGAYAESLSDDTELLIAAYKIADKNPLGSAAGYGSSLPINRQMTTNELNFASLNYNVVYAQMTRGKTEKTASMALASVAATLSKLAMDICLFASQNFNFISFPTHLTTGSSIMPHKKNPDVFELIRGKCNKLQALPNELTLLLTNLPSGYHRDLQLTKEILFPAFSTLNSCMKATIEMLKEIVVNDDVLKDEKYKYLFSVEKVNELVKKGVPFRQAYKIIGSEIDNETFSYEGSPEHTHEGSIGNLMNQQIKQEFAEKLRSVR